MVQHNENIAALIGSRICHDLISPIGAVTNGLELMAMSGGTGGPELDLVTDSASSANAKIRLFRLAFGLASDQQTTPSTDIRAILADVYADSRISVDWQPKGDIPRPLAQAAVLAILCAEKAIALGGAMRIGTTGDKWTISATGARVATDENLWSRLTGPSTDKAIAPADVQFLLLPDHLARLGRHCSFTLSDAGATLEF